MNFCKESDEYISLYIDELLDEEIEKKFLKHIEECSQCAEKLEEAAFIAKLCSEQQEIPLPEDFSSSLHTRLLQISDKPDKKKSVFSLYNKKLIASLSTAAVLVISLLAYNLLPQTWSHNKTASSADSNAQIQASSAPESGISAYNEDMADSNKNSGADSIEQSDQSGEIYPEEQPSENEIKKQGTKEEIPEIKKEKKSVSRDIQEKPENRIYGKIDGNNQETEKNNKLAMVPEIAQPVTEYYSNYAEINLKVSVKGTEIQILKSLMTDIGATQPDQAIYYSAALVPETGGNDKEGTSDTGDNKADSFAADLNYIDYYLTLTSYKSLKDTAANYGLEITAKSDTIKKDITSEYNYLLNQKNEISERISEAVKAGEDVSALQSESNWLTQEIDKLISEKKMVTVRVFFTLN